MSKQGKEKDFCEFLKGLIELAEWMLIEFDVEYVMMDECDACYNAVTKVLPDAKILMCFFHVMKNLKSNCEKPLTKEKYAKLKFDVGFLYCSVSKADFADKVEKFSDEWNRKGTKAVFEYMNKQWLYREQPGQ